MNTKLIAAVNATTKRDAKRHRANLRGWEFYDALIHGNVKKVAELIQFINGEENGN